MFPREIMGFSVFWDIKGLFRSQVVCEKHHLRFFILDRGNRRGAETEIIWVQQSHESAELQYLRRMLCQIAQRAAGLYRIRGRTI